MAGSGARPCTNIAASPIHPFYLSEHSGRTTRRLHFLGSDSGTDVLGAGAGHRQFLVAADRTGHRLRHGLVRALCVEKNRPATFSQPLYSFMGDWRMFWDILTGRIVF